MHSTTELHRNCTTCASLTTPRDVAAACDGCRASGEAGYRNWTPFVIPIGEVQEVGVAGIGDLASDAQGSGARFNAGKPPLELIPFRAIAASLRSPFTPDHHLGLIAALDALGRFQAREGDDHDNLIAAFQAIGTDAWPDCAAVFDYGRKKYAAWNWAKGMAWSVPLACAGRHIFAMLKGELIDMDKPGQPGSQLPHRGHVYCNLVMLWTYQRTYIEGDDRPAKGLFA